MTPTPSHPSLAQRLVIVIGAGLAGWTTVREFRKLDSTTPVLLVTADSGDFYAKPTLSNAFAQKRTAAQLVTTPAGKMVETLKVTLLAHTSVLRIDTTAQVLYTASGELPYRDLVLATGALPIHVPVKGDAAAQVVSVNSLQDFSAFHAVLTAENSCEYSSKIGAAGSPALKQVVIMGAGLIGCEFANDLATAGYRVTVVDPASRALAALLPAAASHQLQAALSALPTPVQWRWGRTVAALDAAAGALQITLSDGESLAADVVLSAIGLRADTRLALAAGLECERGIVVNRHLQTSAPHVYALGDSAQYSNGGTSSVVLPFVMPIMHAAKALAATLAATSADKPTQVNFPLMPIAVKTPALPLVVALPAPGTPGQWVAVVVSAQEGEWHWKDEKAVLPDSVRGFVLAGAATPRRAKLAATVMASEAAVG